MLQVRQIINLAAKRIGAINYGENLDSFSSQTILDIFRIMLDEFSIRTLNYKQYDYTITAKNPIIIGLDEQTSTSGDILERPAKIDEVIVKIGLINYPQVIKNYEEYRKLPITNVNAIPTTCYIQSNFPFYYLYFFPGFGQSSQVQILGRSYLTDENIELNDYLELPREYSIGLMSNLALRIAPFFGVPSDQSLIIEGSSGLKHIKQLELVRSMKTLNNDFVGQRGFNYLTGMY
jgi:hypothetical protein